MFNNPYLRLIRFDKPVGTFLLLWPALWALWIASHKHVSIKLLIIFSLGVFIMRSAGCVINDMADRRFDGFVTRTAKRPLVSGEITPKKAFGLLFFLLLIALLFVFQLNILCFKLACISLFITLIYPFCKRWISAPQCVLGVAFSMSIPMAFAAVDGSLKNMPWILLMIGIIWPIIYDTLYAMVDRNDDLKIGIHSTAILFGQYDKLIIGFLEIAWFILWIILARQQHFHYFFYIALFFAIALCVFEQYAIRNRSPDACFRGFLNHAWIGGILFSGLIFS